MPEKDSEVGNFIEALLSGLDALSEIETVWSFCESDRCTPDKKFKMLYQCVESELREFQDQTGVSAKQLMHKWNKAGDGPQA